MPQGNIARLLIDKGFGFIRDEGGIEHFFHRSAVRGAVFELLHVNSLDERVLASPALVDGRWYFRTDRSLFAIGK